MNWTWAFGNTRSHSDELSFGSLFDFLPVFIINDKNLSDVAIWQHFENVSESDGAILNFSDNNEILLLFVNFKNRDYQTRIMIHRRLLTQIVYGVQNLQKTLASIPIIEFIVPSTAYLVNAFAFTTRDRYPK